jgi:hypothetical protein
MSNIVTQAELLEIVPELRAKAAAEPTEKVREALNRLADRYAAMGGGNGIGYDFPVSPNCAPVRSG